MSRKLYALLILIGAIGALVLAYLYFFVYYTAILTINANVPDYRVELYAPATAQRFVHECPEEICVIPGVSPFEYNISIIKKDYQIKVIPAKIGARRKETFVIELEKKVSLTSLSGEEVQETNTQKIKRLREEKLYYASFQINPELLLSFKKDDGQLLLQYRTQENIRDIGKFPLASKQEIYADSISESEDLFLKVGQEQYILNMNNFTLTHLPFELPIRYIKKGNTEKNYLIVTEKGSFVYNISDNSSEFQYLFKDFLYFGKDIIGIIYDDEDQKKSNFNFKQDGNLIIKYSPKDKTRKIVQSTSLAIDRLEWRGDRIIFSAGENEYELKNFD